MFSTQSDNCIAICPYFDIIPLLAAEFEEPKIGISGNYIIYKTMPRFNDPVEDLSKVKNIFLVVKTSFMRKKTFESLNINPTHTKHQEVHLKVCLQQKKIRMNCLPMK